MALQKFEKEFREKLLNREMKPSADSWDKLEAQLEAGKEKKNYRYWWMGIAASVAGAIFMVNQFYLDPVVPVSPEYVENPVEAEQTEEVPGIREIPVVEETIVATRESEEPIKAPGIKKQQPLIVQTTAEAVAAVENQEQQLLQTGKQGQDPPVEKELITAKLEEVVAEVSLHEESGIVTDSEIDALLNKAATELVQQRAGEAVAGNVDHESLLMEVEMDLERSFREKVLEILKEGYVKTRTAVANRSL